MKTKRSGPNCAFKRAVVDCVNTPTRFTLDLENPREPERHPFLGGSGQTAPQDSHLILAGQGVAETKHI